MLRRVLYVSSSIKPFSNQELKRLLGRCRVNNRLSGVTGALLYLNGNFLQVLEGPAEDVAATLERIKKDQRHRGLLVLSDREVEERCFPQWSMGFETVSSEDLAAHQDVFKLNADQFRNQNTGGLEQQVEVLVETFLAVNELAPGALDTGVALSA